MNPPTKASRPSKLGKKGAPEAVMVLSASAEGHERPRAEPATDILYSPLDDGYPERLVRIESTLDPLIKDAIVSLLK